MGRAASTVTSSLPLGSRRTLPGVAGPSGITSISRWTPSASVTAKIASISFIVTTSSMHARLGGAFADLAPGLVVDRDAVGAPLALRARLRLAGDEDLLRAGGRRRRAHPAEQRRHLGVELRRRQEARGIEAHDQRAVAEHRRLVAGGAGARQDAGQDLDGQREPVAPVRAGR